MIRSPRAPSCVWWRTVTPSTVGSCVLPVCGSSIPAAPGHGFGTQAASGHAPRSERRLPTLRRLRLPRRALAERGLGGGEACDGNAERRARDVIERNLVAERDGGGVAAVLAADPDLELRLRLPTALDADPHQFAHALAVAGDERMAPENPPRHVGAEKARSVVAADAEGGLGQVVGAEG